MKIAHTFVNAALGMLCLACGDSDDGWDDHGAKNKWSADKKHVDVEVAPRSFFDTPRTVRCTCEREDGEVTCAMIIGDPNGVGPQYSGLTSATVNGKIVIAFAKCDPRFTNYSVFLPLSEL